MTALPKTVSFIRSTPALSELRETLQGARSVSAAALMLGINRKRLVDYCRQTTDLELRSLYRSCVERGKRREPELSPYFGIYWRAPEGWIRIWGVDAVDEDDAMVIALRATGRNQADLKVVKENRK